MASLPKQIPRLDLSLGIVYVMVTQITLPSAL